MADAAVPLESLETFAHGLDHPEGICATPDGRLYVGGEGGQLYRVEDDGGITEIASTGGFMLGLAADGSAGARRLLCDLDPAVPDGVALTEDGAFYIACYRPDAVYRWHPDEGLSVVAEDPRGTVLAAPTNIVFGGENRDVIVVPNIGRWHITRFPPGPRGIPLEYPTRAQLGS